MYQPMQVYRLSTVTTGWGCSMKTDTIDISVRRKRANVWFIKRGGEARRYTYVTRSSLLRVQRLQVALYDKQQGGA